MTEQQLARVDVPMNSELWAQLHAGTVPTTDGAVRILENRALDELRAHHKYTEQEVDYVERQPAFHESARAGYLSALDTFRRRRTLPAHIRITFPRPASREGGFWKGRAAA